MKATDNSITCTDKDINPCNGEAAYGLAKEALGRLQRDGYAMLPDWLPFGLPGYDWQICGPFVAMKPKPKLRHILRYKLQPKWYGKMKAKRSIAKLFAELKQDNLGE